MFIQPAPAVCQADSQIHDLPLILVVTAEDGSSLADKKTNGRPCKLRELQAHASAACGWRGGPHDSPSL